MKQETDNGNQAESLLNNNNIILAINKLNKEDRAIIKMLSEGYTQSEVILKYKTNYPYIKRLLKRLKTLID